MLYIVTVSALPAACDPEGGVYSVSTDHAGYARFERLAARDRDAAERLVLRLASRCSPLGEWKQ